MTPFKEKIYKHQELFPERGRLMSNKRIVLIFFVFTTSLVALTVRFCYLHLAQGDELSSAASSQRLSSATIEKPRGKIVDKNLIPLTGRSIKTSVLLEPFFLKGKVDSIGRICDVLGLDFNKLKSELDYKRQPVILESDYRCREDLLKLGIKGVSVINMTERYGKNSVAWHVLGYLNQVDQTGSSGIEKAYENILKTDGENSINVITDAKDNLVEGIGYRIKKESITGKKLNIKLTIDYHIQKIVESVMEKNNITGAVVVEDVLNGDVVAISSKPDFRQNDVGNYLESPGKELFNRAVASYNIGSIFKIISAARALESGISLGGDYFCSGALTLGNRDFKCSSFEKGGHGMIDFNNAFALSCNTYFIELGLKIGARNMVDMAGKFGLGKVTGLSSQGIDESCGMLPDLTKPYTDGDVANLAIGQGNVMATPVQIADIVATVANGGIKNRLNIVDSVVDEVGNKENEIKVNEGKRIISKQTAEKIKELMEAAANYGTAVRANIPEFGGAGGKTGSAETGQYTNGEKIVHAWFAGYFPRVNPRYSVAVFVENGKSGGDAAAPLFKEIGEEILKKKF